MYAARRRTGCASQTLYRDAISVADAVEHTLDAFSDQLRIRLGQCFDGVPSGRNSAWRKMQPYGAMLIALTRTTSARTGVLPLPPYTLRSKRDHQHKAQVSRCPPLYNGQAIRGLAVRFLRIIASDSGEPIWFSRSPSAGTCVPGCSDRHPHASRAAVKPLGNLASYAIGTNAQRLVDMHVTLRDPPRCMA